MLRRNAFLASIFLSLAACTANWQAPLETRGSQPKSSPSRAAARSPSPSLQQQTHYKVRSGDTLYSIAWRSQNDYRTLARWNNLGPPYTIYAGQILRLTAPAKPKPAPSKPQPSKTAALPAPSAAKPSRSNSTPKSQAAPTAPKQSAPAKPPSNAPAATSTAKPKANSALRWIWPADGQVVSGFQSGSRFKQGIKIKGQYGARVKATEAGKVVYSGSGLIGYGRLIIIKHNDTYLSAYGHNRKLLVQQGQQVTKGQDIAELGRANDGQSLLHFEIRKDGKPVNPVSLLPRR